MTNSEHYQRPVLYVKGGCYGSSKMTEDFYTYCFAKVKHE